MPPEYRRGTPGGHQRNSAATGVEFRQLTAIDDTGVHEPVNRKIVFTRQEKIVLWIIIGFVVALILLQVFFTQTYFTI
jgi:hypothetical protein|tara:strand:- start:1029 stop:1262 length:234 start_codon:yes stop_codon:yes gene_type:complete